MSRCARFFSRRKRMMEALDQDIRDYLERETQDNIERGMPPEEARYAALRKFGNVTRVKEETWEVWSFVWLEQLWRDIRFGVRQLRRSPGFALVAVVTLALGIGANTAIFSVVWRPLRYFEPDRLLLVWETRPDGTRSPVALPTYLDWRDQNTCFEQLAASRRESAALAGNPPSLITATSITPNFFDTFHLRVSRGRFFTAGEFRPESRKAVILSYEFWQTHFGAEADVVGRTIRLNGDPYAVTGVAPPDFEFMGSTDVYVPLPLSAAEHDRQARDLLVVGRMKRGVTPAQAEGQMRVLGDRVAQASPETNKHWCALAEDFRQALAGPGVRLMLVLLFATVSVVLLMACGNVASLLLARATTRQKEIGVRIALGASRWRIVRQLLVETLLLALMGAGLGLLLAGAAVRYLATLTVLQAPGLAPIKINAAVLEFACVMTVIAAVLSGFAPALQTRSARLLEHVRASARTTQGERAQSRLRKALVAGGLALCLMLMAVAGLTVRSFIRLTRVDPGFPTMGLTAAHLDLPAPEYPDSNHVRAFYSRLLEQVKALPNVQDAAISTALPPAPVESGQPFRLEGGDPSQPGSDGVARYQVISPGYFRTLGIAVRKGRAFTVQDIEDSMPVVIINRRLAEKFFPYGDPVGRRLLIPEAVRFGNGPPHQVTAEIVGVVNDVKNVRLTEPSSPGIYLSYLQAARSGEYVVIRSQGESAPLISALRKAVSTIDPNLPLTSVSTMHERFSRSLAGRQIVVTLMTVFALIALAMGSVGLYGVISYSATQRTGEFAVRIALGAQRRQIFGLVAHDVLHLLAVGGATGMALGLGAGRLLRGLMFGISPYDPITFLAVALILLLVVLSASYVPARRATKVDPMVALRYE
jgi:putative ABC transport system permease protein